MYKVALKEHIRFVISLFRYAFLTFIAFTILSYFKLGYLDVRLAIYLGVQAYLLLITPKLLLYLNYYLTNKNMVVYYDETQKQMRVTDKGRDITFEVVDVKTVTEYKTYPKAENRTTWMPWDDYHYSLVELKNGEKFYFTSLILPNLNLPIDKSKITLKKRFYPATW